MHDFYNISSISNWFELPLNIDNYKDLQAPKIKQNLVKKTQPVEIEC